MASFQLPIEYWPRNLLWILASFGSYDNNRCISWTFRIQTRSRRQLSEGSRWRRAIRNLTIYLRPAGNNLFVNHFLKIYCWTNFVINLKRGCWDHRLYWMQKSADFSPELVGEIDSSEVKDINGHNWKIGELYITAGDQKNANKHLINHKTLSTIINYKNSDKIQMSHNFSSYIFVIFIAESVCTIICPFLHHL